jgi:3-oxoacyl-[acyl-carrier-protein] synthase III
MSTRAVIQSTGHGLPKRVMTNDEIAQLVETSDEWIAQRTGIRERRICGPEETSGTLASAAAREAVERAGIDAQEIEMIVCATVTGEYLWPATATMIQESIGASRAGAFDVSAACAGFIYGLDTVAAMIETGRVGTALVIGVDALSRQVDWTDRSTCVLFGDAAGAVVVRGEEGTDRGVLSTVLLADGTGRRHIAIDVGGSRIPFGSEAAEGLKTTLTMNGAEVYRFAVNAMGDACCRVLERSKLTPEDIDLFVPHQANLRIIESAAKRLGLPPEKVFVNVHKYGNTSGGSIPLGLYEAEREGRLKPGMIVMTVGFGAGLVWGANLIRW